MATRSRARLTPEQRDERRRQQLDQLREATSALLTSEGWQRWLRTRSRFHRYSLRNTLLIAFQCPHATVASPLVVYERVEVVDSAAVVECEP